MLFKVNTMLTSRQVNSLIGLKKMWRGLNYKMALYYYVRQLSPHATARSSTRTLTITFTTQSAQCFACCWRFGDSHYIRPAVVWVSLTQCHLGTCPVLWQIAHRKTKHEILTLSMNNQSNIFYLLTVGAEGYCCNSMTHTHTHTRARAW